MSDIKIVYVPVDKLKPAEYNPRRFGGQQSAQLKESIGRFGLIDPIIVNGHAKRKDIVIGGHFRLKIAKELGFETVPVVYISIGSEEKERELNLRLNKNLGEFDYDLLANFDQDMLSEVGFSSEELDSIFDLSVKEDEADLEADLSEAKKNPKTKPGDVYILGNHRLMCGDSTLPEDVERLMNNELADMVFTDPPYNVDYKADKYRGIDKERKSKFQNDGKIKGDKQTKVQFKQFLVDCFENVYTHSKPSMALYVCHATKTQKEFFDALQSTGFHYSQTIIWLKERVLLTLGQDFMRIYEPIWFGWKKGEKRYANRTIKNEKEVWDLDGLDFEERLNLWQINRDKSVDYEHPTQKPVRLSERAIKKHSKRGGGCIRTICGFRFSTIGMRTARTSVLCYGA